jgi:hypothetical protein
MPATSPIDAPSGKPHFQRSFLNLSHQPYATGGSRSHAGLTAGTLYPTNRETQCEPALRATLRMLAHLCLARVTALRDEAVARRGRQARPSDKCVRALLQNSWCDLSRWKVPLAGPQAARCTAPAALHQEFVGVARNHQLFVVPDQEDPDAGVAWRAPIEPPQRQIVSAAIGQPCTA